MSQIPDIDALLYAYNLIAWFPVVAIFFPRHTIHKKAYQSFPAVRSDEYRIVHTAILSWPVQSTGSDVRRCNQYPDIWNNDNAIAYSPLDNQPQPTILSFVPANPPVSFEIGCLLLHHHLEPVGRSLLPDCGSLHPAPGFGAHIYKPPSLAFVAHGDFSTAVVHTPSSLHYIGNYSVPSFPPVPFCSLSEAVLIIPAQSMILPDLTS